MTPSTPFQNMLLIPLDFEAGTHYAILTERVNDALQTHFPKGQAVPKACWMSADAWNLIRVRRAAKSLTAKVPKKLTKIIKNKIKKGEELDEDEENFAIEYDL